MQENVVAAALISAVQSDAAFALNANDDDDIAAKMDSDEDESLTEDTYALIGMQQADGSFEPSDKLAGALLLAPSVVHSLPRSRLAPVGTEKVWATLLVLAAITNQKIGDLTE